MNTINNGGPAFPSHGSMGEVTHEGMTLRDYFAAKALNGFIAGGMADGTPLEKDSAEIMANAAYRFADAMIRARGAA